MVDYRKKIVNFAEKMGRLAGSLFIPSLLICAFKFNNVWLGLIPPVLPIVAVGIYVAIHWSGYSNQVLRESLEAAGINLDNVPEN